jgi:two-component system sensor histidine kinase HydH
MGPALDSTGSLDRLRRNPWWRAWVDLSLRAKLRLFALGLVTIPGGAFALMAFSSTRAALEREVEIQLHQTAEQGAQAVASVLERARSDARSWASQDVMRDLMVGDLDKRVSRFLQTVIENEPSYLAVLCTDREGATIAASSGDWIGRDVGSWNAMMPPASSDEGMGGPVANADFDREVLEFGVAIRNPDAPADRIGTLILVYDWAALRHLLDGIRIKLEDLDKHVAAVIVGDAGVVIGGVSFGGVPARESSLAAERWGAHAERDRSVGVGRRADARPAGLLVGAARIADADVGWRVLFVERTADALAPVRRVRARWIVIMGGILLVGLMVATLLARQVMRPLDEMTRATSQIASHPDRSLPLLPVRSRNEVGQLTESFNTMTTELKRSQEETLSAAKFAFAGELAAMVAHEVRTPLSVLRSSAQMLVDPESQRTASNAELVETIVAEVDRVERVVTGLIQLARPLPQSPEPTFLADVLSRAAEFAGAHAETHGISIACETAGPDDQAFCDPEQMYQVVLNLLVNALQVLPHGGRIRLRTVRQGGGMTGFEVADDGPGLPPAIRDQIFLPFVTGRDGGTGLGLAFVDRVVKAHRGSVSVRSEPGSGTVFTVRLPVARVMS